MVNGQFEIDSNFHFLWAFLRPVEKTFSCDYFPLLKRKTGQTLSWIFF